MIILSAKNLEVQFGAELLFKNVTFEADKQDKIGLTGVNGSGKTTLFKILAGLIEPDKGTVSKASGLKTGYMEQHVVRDRNITAYEEVLSVFSEVAGIEKELEQLHDIIDAGNASEEILNRQMRLQEKAETMGSLTYRARTASALSGLGFSSEEQQKDVSVLSGGEKSKLQLAKLLLSGADLLLLDEPTNHLDIKACEWLEKFLLDYKGAYIVISHDRYFLDKVTNKTLEMDNHTLTVYKGNYTRSRQLRREQRDFIKKQYEQTLAEIKRIEGIIEQQKRFNQAHNYVTIASKQKQIDRLTETLVKPPPEPETLRFNFISSEGSGNDVLFTSNLSMTFNGKSIFRNVSLDIKRQERVFILGRNGCGKTTLLKILTGEYTPSSGSVKLGARVRLGYFDQIQTGLSPEKTVIDEIWDVYPKMTQTEVRTALGSFLFHGDDVFKTVKTLSGGEKARVALLKLMLSGCNLLLLDEPTNHLDITSKEALENAFSSYTGTLIIVSHDRYLINKLATKLCLLTENGVETINGNYDSIADRFAFVSNQAPQSDNNTNTARLTYKQQKERESVKRKLLGKLSRTEQQITDLENTINQKNLSLSSPEIAADYLKFTDLTSEIETLNNQLAALMQTWEDLSDQLENMAI